MKHLFEEVPAHSAVVVVTHKPAVLAHVSRVLVVDQGRVVLDGPRDAVLARLRGTAPTAPPAAAVSQVNAVEPSVAKARGQA
jgi:ATP-binding cassette subfamily C protein LapB